MPTTYEQLLNTQGEISNIATGQRFKSPTELAGALGIQPHEIDWTKISTTPTAKPEIPPIPVIGVDTLTTTPSSAIMGLPSDKADKAELERLKIQQEIANVKTALLPTDERAKLDVEAEYKKLLAEPAALGGVSYTQLQQKVIDLTKVKEERLSRLGAFKTSEQKGVPKFFAAGRISEEEQKAQEEIDTINRELNVANSQISNRNDVINTMMQLKKEVYQTASVAYDKEFANNLSIYNAIRGEKEKAVTAEALAKEQTADNARASLKTLQDDIQKGAMPKYDALPKNVQNTIDNLELQSKMVGLTKVIEAKVNAKDNVIASGTRTDKAGNEYFDILTKTPEGKLETQSVFRGKGKLPETEVLESQIRQDIIDTLTDKEGTKNLGRELTLTDMIKLFPDVSTEKLKDAMTEFYDYEALTAEEMTKPWWKFWED
ncbi:MAG: hypothetical protein UT51_C0013G0005 [Candidatus Nomurabacteria bacterium GW2011_GWC2_39_41]|uniref:Uncharacterized protein n=2 Tax=Parcubacteria group TaxID=1794811 RepID=A0A0G1PQI5_9BACT|nr:MAG: hypothetical protein UT51_C0013G0005 [Candidatus Nomurabacteria bacterium GW2011_GWC2_39_41]KKU35034.1 MAG: hypothetical protein UX48_C0020G0004 [Candidatus Azambacteria bacterium GW2011_GWB1_46_27]